jgi:hypothetical protein
MWRSTRLASSVQTCQNIRPNFADRFVSVTYGKNIQVRIHSRIFRQSGNGLFQVCDGAWYEYTFTRKLIYDSALCYSYEIKGKANRSAGREGP